MHNFKLQNLLAFLIAIIITLLQMFITERNLFYFITLSSDISAASNCLISILSWNLLEQNINSNIEDIENLFRDYKFYISY